MLFNARMKTNDELRRENLLLAIARMGNAAKLAEAAGTSPAYISQIKNRTPDSKTGVPKMMGDDMARRIETALGEGPGWLDQDHSVDAAPQFEGAIPVRMVDQDDPEFIQIPMVRLRLQAGMTGFQTEPERRDGGTMGMRRSWIERNDFNPARLIAIQVKGESMEPSLYEGDVVVINTADTKMVDGQVYAINYEGEAVVKRLSRDAGEWWLTSDNLDQRKYHRKICRGGECIVVGRVVRKESDRI